MKINLNYKTAPGKRGLITRVAILGIFSGTLLFSSFQVAAQGVDPILTRPVWWFGGAAGANFNTYRGTTQKLNADLTVPAAFHPGRGVGLYLGPLMEYHNPTNGWGVMLQAGYDSHRGKFKETMSPCNCPANLSTNLSYVTVEPSLRFAPFNSNMYLFAGPRISFNTSRSFTYTQGNNPAYPDQEARPDIKGDFSDINATLLSGQIGAGYDIALSPKASPTQFVLSPFVAFQPYFGQNPRSIETWTVSTWRVGAAFKFGRGRPRVFVPTEKVEAQDKDVKFSVNAPKNIPTERRVKETFPLSNYVFFDLGSTAIPNRYELLKKSEVKDFKEDNLEVFKPKNLSGRSERQMIVYYNVINIIGNRMTQNPAAAITLVGSSEEGPEDGRAMAQSIKKYLVDVWAIDGSRISIEGRDKPKIPSEKPGGTNELGLLREGDRRVSIESNSPAMLMEFQSGPNAQLKPVEIIAIQEAPLDSYVAFDVTGAEDALTSWTLEIKDEAGKVQNFGPYTQDKVAIPGKSILGTRPEGDYTVTMVGKTKSGKTIRKETPVHMVLWTPPKNEEGTRFSVIYEFNESKAITMYDKYLTDVIAPNIPRDGTVLIHGYTDIIGDDAHNQELSLARAKDVKAILEKGLKKAGRNDVKFQIFGFGEDPSLSPFENRYPEERSYNRTVVIDVIPKE